MNQTNVSKFIVLLTIYEINAPFEQIAIIKLIDLEKAEY